MSVVRQKDAARDAGAPAGGDAVRIIVADDHEVVRRGLRGLLEAQGYQVVGEASDGNEAVDLAGRLTPDIVILDITMPRLNGLEAARRIKSASPATEILILSMHCSEQTVEQVLKSGARGYILKSDAGDELVAAVKALHAHQPYFTGEVSRQLLDAYLREPVAHPGAGTSGRVLTGREQEVVQLLAEGKSNKEIAGLLNLSTKTVETHRSNIMRKLELHSLSDLIHYALRNNLIVA
jgi:DNA-binding NarL/FixJ family response regulator